MVVCLTSSRTFASIENRIAKKITIIAIETKYLIEVNNKRELTIPLSDFNQFVWQGVSIIGCAIYTVNAQTGIKLGLFDTGTQC